MKLLINNRGVRTRGKLHKLSSQYISSPISICFSYIYLVFVFNYDVFCQNMAGAVDKVDAVKDVLRFLIHGVSRSNEFSTSQGILTFSKFMGTS